MTTMRAATAFGLALMSVQLSLGVAAERGPAPEPRILQAAMPPQRAELVAKLPPGDPERGQKLYQSRCIACHSLDENRVGPRHRGVFGRKAGSVPDYAYSKSVKTSDVVWGPESLDDFLANPGKFIPGSKMGYRLSKPQDRADVIAFLRRESGA